MAQGNTKLGWVVAGLLLGIFIASMDNTIVATAMGTIVSDLGGLDKFVWVTSAYMVAEMAGMPIFGKLSDMYGRKRFFIFGLFVFLLGSVLCGTAHNIVQLSVYRAIQGIGGGALVPIAFTIMFDVFPVQQRGKMGGLFGATFGLSSIFGPLLGAYITDYINWRWVFYVNLPLGLAALAMLLFAYRESHEHSRQPIDWLGSLTLVGGVVALIFALELGGNTYAWHSPQILGLFAAALVLFLVFFPTERSAKEPVVSFALFRSRLFSSSTIIGFFSGGTFVVATVFIPIFIQGVLGGSATNSGLVLLPMMLGSVVSSQMAAMSVSRISYRSIMLLFMAIFTLGIGLLCTLSIDTTRLIITIYMIVVGLGIGASFSVLGMTAIHGLTYRQRGSASATLSFIRELGMAVGITIYGVIQRNLFTGKLSALFPGAGGQGTAGFGGNTRELLTPAGRAKIPQAILDRISAALSGSIAHTFEWALIPAALSLMFVFYMTGDKLVAWPEAEAGNAGGAESAERG